MLHASPRGRAKNIIKKSLLQKRFVGMSRFFFRDGPKFHPLEQMKWGYCSIRTAPRNVFLGAPKNKRNF